MDASTIAEALKDGPRSRRELGVPVETLRSLATQGVVVLDPDRWPDERVPGNPLIVRLPGDDRPWSGWKRWNL